MNEILISAHPDSNCSQCVSFISSESKCYSLNTTIVRCFPHNGCRAFLSRSKLLEEIESIKNKPEILWLELGLSEAEKLQRSLFEGVLNDKIYVSQCNPRVIDEMLGQPPESDALDAMMYAAHASEFLNKEFKKGKTNINEFAEAMNKINTSENE